MGPTLVFSTTTASTTVWLSINMLAYLFNTLGPEKNGRHSPDDIFECIFLNEHVWISFKISLNFVPKGSVNNNPALVWIMAWRRPGDKPLSEPIMVSLWSIYESLCLNELITSTCKIYQHRNIVIWTLRNNLYVKRIKQPFFQENTVQTAVWSGSHWPQCI